MQILIITQTVDKNNPVLGFFHNWLTEFAHHCERIEVICLSEGAHDLPANVHVHSLGKEAGASRFVILKRFFQKIIALHKTYDHVFVHMNQVYVLLGGIYWRFMNKKIGLWYAHKQVSVSLKIAEKLAHIIFTPSKESFRITSSKVFITGHGIPTNLFTPKQAVREPLIITTIGRIAPVKQLETLISAIKILHDRNITCTVQIFGSPITNTDQVYKKTLENQIRDLNLKQIIQLKGSISNFATIAEIQNSSLIINTSLTGSMDKSILEAMSCGVLVITSNESFAQILPKSLTFKQGDAIELAEKIITATQLTDIGHAKLSSELRKIVIENHNLSKLIEKVVLKYKNSIKSF